MIEKLETIMEKYRELTQKVVDPNVIADNMERTRTYPGVEKVRELAFRDLTAAVKLGLSNTIENLKTRAEGIHPQGLATLAWLNERKRGYVKCKRSGL